MKVSTRINSRVTSIQVRDSVIAMHYLFSGGVMPCTSNSVRDHVLDVCHDIIGSWEGTGRGLSSHITDCMLKDVLHSEETKDYDSIMGVL